MFSTSTQLKNWMYGSIDELDKLRMDANLAFIRRNHDKTKLPEEKLFHFFLDSEDEKMLINFYQNLLRDFCKGFKPPMPPTVIGTAMQYYKRFYLNNSVMDYHPKNVLVTCSFLACKVEEFNVSLDQFVDNIKGDKSRAATIVLSNELLLMQQLKYHLTVHNPYRPIEGFLIDIKTRANINEDVESFRKDIDEYIEKTWSTDACLLFSPSQIALAVLSFAAAKSGADIDGYITNVLLDGDAEKDELLTNMKEYLWSLIHQKNNIDKHKVRALDKKLENCRNQANNPDSSEYKKASGDSSRTLEATSSSLNEDSNSNSEPAKKIPKKEIKQEVKIKQEKM